MNKETPQLTFMLWAQNADTPALKQNRLTQKTSPRLLQFCSGYRIWHASRAWKRKTRKNVDFHTANNVQKQATPFHYFLDEFF